MIRRTPLLLACALLFTGSASAEVKHDWQGRYTVKFLCGTNQDKLHLVHSGHYRTSVSIYNADFNLADVSLLVATIDPRTGEAVPVKEHLPLTKSVTISPHKVWLLGCDELRKLQDPVPGPGDASYGLLLISSKQYLEVTFAHTVAADEKQPASSISLGQASRQAWRNCGPTTIRLSDTRNWQTVSRGVQPVEVASRVRGEKKDKWFEYNPRGPQPIPDYVYRLPYCICSGEGTIEGDVQSEGLSRGTLNAGAVNRPTDDVKVEVLWPQSRDEVQKLSKIRLPRVGDGYIEARVSAGRSAVSFTGTITLQNGHAGACTP